MLKLCRLFFLVVLLLSFGSMAAAQEGLGRSYFDLGVFAFEDKDHDAAIENFKKALSYSPSDPYYNYYLGKTYLDMERYDEAHNYLERAWKKDSSVEGLDFDYALLHFKTSDYQRSADIFADIVKADPSNILAQYYCGISLYELKRYREALNYFLEASTKSPTIKANGFYYAGVCYRKMGKDREAVEKFEYVKENAPGQPLREYAAKWLNAIEEEKKLLKPYNLYAKIGYQYDDNVRLEPLDQGDLYADEGDTLLLGLFSGKYRFVNQRKYTMGAGLSTYQTRHDKLYQYDLMALIGDLNLTYRVNPFSFGLAYMPSKYWVNADEYIMRHQLKPEMTWKVNERLVSKLSYSYFINDHLIDDDRDGNTMDLFLDNYFSVINSKCVVFAGIGYEDNDASHDDYSYGQLKTRIGLSLTFFRDFNLTLTAKYNDKTYENVDSSYWKKRSDSKTSGSASLSSKLFYNWLKILLEYSFTDNQSNIDDHTYQRSMTTLSLLASF